MATMIKLQGITGNMLTAYSRGGQTRKGGRVPDTREVLTVSQAPSPGWKLAPTAMSSYVDMDEAVREAGGARLRLLDAFRSPKIQGAARSKYETWLKAGKPDPSSTQFNRILMKSSFVSKPGESNHGWGGAVDIDVDALEFPGTGRGTDAALDTFWDIATNWGWNPIIAHPNIDQSEAWHFDHLGPLGNVRRMFLDHASEGARYRRPYALVAQVGCILAGTMSHTVPHLQVRFIQSRLLIAGFWCGEPDGYIGKKTFAALEEAKIKGMKKTTPIPIVLGMLNERKIGTSQLDIA